MKELPKAYDASQVEEKIYKMWQKSGYFNPDNLPERHKEPFVISLPPPNVTGVLHIGHAFEDTIQDSVVRYQRMRGKKTMWVPGTDHAAIATQAKFEKEHYKKEDKSRHDYSRSEFFEMIQKYALTNQKGILSQLHKLGLSLDWSRLAFTLDEQRELAVKTAFKKMFDAGLIYRGHRLVNWDPKGQTTVSDDEIEYVEQKDPFYYFKYGPFTIATVRPETKFGDKYVVMHPDDKRYEQYKHGQKIELEWINGPITATIIKDRAAEMEVGSGVMTITPAHSAVDFEIAQRHNLDIEQIIDEKGILLPIAGEFAGQHIKKARPKVVEKLKAKGLVEKTDENYIHRVATNMRGGGIIEPQIKLQWFIDVNKKFVLENSKISAIPAGSKTTLKEIMKKTVESKQIQITPKRFEKTYYHWIDNLKDWCISRQIIYGHQIPVYYCKQAISNLSSSAKAMEDQQVPISNQNLKSPPDFATTKSLRAGKILNLKSECQQPIVNIKDIKDCPYCKGPVERDPDTLDTWFSSGLWTFSTLGWPNDALDLKTYHPTSVMMPGYEILFFWVARMILMSGFLLGDIPFHQVYLHGIVRDKQGRKFSKSLNNGIDPLEMMSKYGTDALRMALIFGAAPGNDVIFDEQKVKGMKHFANKLWNIARFVITNLENYESSVAKATKDRSGIMNYEFKSQTPSDTEILTKLDAVVKSATKNLNDFHLHEAAQDIYQFVWHEFADVYIEASKSQLNDEEIKQNTLAILLHCLIVMLKTLHPFMPFITEELWSKLREEKLVKNDDLLLIQQWPK